MSIHYIIQGQHASIYGYLNTGYEYNTFACGYIATYYIVTLLTVIGSEYGGASLARTVEYLLESSVVLIPVDSTIHAVVDRASSNNKEL